MIFTACLVLGFYILIKDKTSPLNRSFFIDALLLNIVIVFTVIIQFSVNADTALYLQSIYNIFLIIFLLFSLYYCIRFSEKKTNPVLWTVLLVWSCIIFALVVHQRTSLLNVYDKNSLWVYKLIRPKFWFLLYSPLLSTIMLSMIYYLYSVVKHSVSRKLKLQAITIMSGIIFAFVSGFIFLMILPQLDFYEMPLLTPYFFALFLFSVFYSITRYKLMSFNVKDIAQLVLSHIKELVIILKPDLRVIYINSYGATLFNKKPDNLKDISFLSLIENSETFFSEISGLMRGDTESIANSIVYNCQPDALITDSNLSRVYDSFGDFEAILIVSRENRGYHYFKKLYRLTSREIELIFFAITGYTNKEIAQHLDIKERTVETHLNNIYNKVNVCNKMELFRLFSDTGKSNSF